jgi:sugar lactone lactonase YvrE
MKRILLILTITTLIGCKSVSAPTISDNKIEEVASFKGQQVTGLSISEQGRIFANFPRWRKGVVNSVVEIDKNGISHAFPDENWNSWEIGQPEKDLVFIAVQSVIASEDELYVLDTRNPLFKGVLDNPRVFVFNLETHTLKRTYIFQEDSFHQDSYINDLRIDKKKGKAYFTDSGHAGLVILDLVDGTTKRVLDNHYSTLAEKDHLIIGGNKWNNTVHSDGIALDTENDQLYYHSLTGYNLYSIPTDVLINGTQADLQKEVKFIKKTPAPDGMLFDTKGNLYFADLENQKIMKFNISSGKMNTFAEGEKIKWADTFSIYKNTLYYTNSRINEINGPITDMEFNINKIDLD